MSRDATDIIRIITEHTQLKKQGSQWMGLCPFHGEKSPSFSVNAEKGVYYCFGCQTKGDAIDFVREALGLDFAGSVEFLASKAGITLRYTDQNEGRSRNRRREHAGHVGRAVEFYHQRLLEDPGGPPGTRVPPVTGLRRRRRPAIQHRVGSGRVVGAVHATFA